MSTVSGAQTNASYSYGYDGLHSLKSEAGSAISPRLPQDSPFNYASPSHRLASYRTGVTGETCESSGTDYPFTYDANGNMTSGWDVSTNIPIQRAIAWNADNMPKSITYGGQTTAFLYDGSATRVKKTGISGSTYYIGKHFETVNGVKTRHIFAGGLRIAQISGGIRYYHHKDHLGSTIGVTDDASALVWKTDYEPYGLQRNSWQKTTGMSSLIRHRYTDQEFDAETGLYNYNARLYDPSIARFISPDTIVEVNYLFEFRRGGNHPKNRS
jgi:RHS repeat-associated protein